MAASRGLPAEIVKPGPPQWPRGAVHHVLECKACGGERRIVAGITERKVVVRILEHLGLPTEIPALARARPPPSPPSPEHVDCEADWVPYDESSDCDST